MGSIFCIGQSAYDITIPLDGAICENQKYRVTQKEECGGGPAFNAAYLCAMWGEKVELISRIGNDTYGKRLLEIAARYHYAAHKLGIVNQMTRAYLSEIPLTDL